VWGQGRGRAPSPHKSDRGHKQSHDPPLAKSGRFSWETLDEMVQEVITLNNVKQLANAGSYAVPPA